MLVETPIKVCGCGRTFTRAELDRLVRRKDWITEDETGRYLLEQRDCPCGSTLGIEHRIAARSTL